MNFPAGDGGVGVRDGDEMAVDDTMVLATVWTDFSLGRGLLMCV